MKSSLLILPFLLLAACGSSKEEAKKSSDENKQVLAISDQELTEVGCAFDARNGLLNCPDTNDFFGLYGQLKGVITYQNKFRKLDTSNLSVNDWQFVLDRQEALTYFRGEVLDKKVYTKGTADPKSGIGAVNRTIMMRLVVLLDHQLTFEFGEQIKVQGLSQSNLAEVKYAIRALSRDKEFFEIGASSTEAEKEFLSRILQTLIDAASSLEQADSQTKN